MDVDTMLSMRQARRNGHTAWAPRHTPLVAHFIANYTEPWPGMTQAEWTATAPPF